MLLAIDTSSLVLSCALAEKDRLISEWTVQRKLTHSEQLIPHLDNMMKDAGVSREEITEQVKFQEQYFTTYIEM